MPSNSTSMQCQASAVMIGGMYHWAITGAMLSVGTWLVPTAPLIIPKRTCVFTLVGSPVIPSNVSWLSLDGPFPSWTDEYTHTRE